MRRVAERIDFRALGPLEVRFDGGPGPHLAPIRLRLLAALLARPGRLTSTGELTGAMWSGPPPRSAPATLQVHIHRLRQALGDPERIQRRPAGYRIDVTSEEFDVLRFNDLVESARRDRAEGRPHRAVETLEGALGLWSGEPYGGVEPSGVVAAAVDRLNEQRLTARQELYEMALDTGGHLWAVGPLSELAEAHPYFERLSALLMIALYRSGRQADALEVYRRRRAQMVDGLGMEPGALLRRVHEAVLRSDERLDEVATETLDRRWEPVAAPAVETGAPVAVPRELPRGPDRLAGRDEELRLLDEIAESGPAPLALITGMCGVGKTALAVHWAHRVADRFPDGQLFLDLRGDRPDAALRPLDALGALLASVGVPSAEVPFDLDQAAARFRTRTGDRRMLIVLDNAAEAEQVRPLLPGGSGCMVVVTSRRRLAGLTVREGGFRLSLDPLSPEDAQGLLAELLDEPAARTAELAELCGRLPLALRIAAAVLADRPGLDLGAYTEWLSAGDRLSALQIDGEADAAVRVVFDSAYQALPSETRRLFRLLGTAPGTDISAEAATRLSGTDRSETERNLEHLVATHLVDRHLPGRYRLHDLLRLYAAERAEAEEPRQVLDAAIERLLRWYLGGADAGHRQLYRNFSRLPPDAEAEHLELDRDEAAAWLEAEHANLVAAVVHASEHGPRRIAWLLNDALRGHLWLGGHGLDALKAGRAAVSAARAEGDLAGEAVSELSLTTAMLQRNRSEAALAHGLRAVEISAEAGHLPGLAAAEQNVAYAYFGMGRLDEAIEHGEAALRTDLKLGLLHNQISDLMALALAYQHRGDLDLAIDRLERAVGLAAETERFTYEPDMHAHLAAFYSARGRPEQAESYLDLVFRAHRESPSLSNLDHHYSMASVVHLEAGRVESALEYALKAVEYAQGRSGPLSESIALTALGAARDARGEHREAIACFDRAIELTGNDGIFYRTEAALGRAGARLRLGQAGPARADAESALETARECGFKLLEARALDLLASM